MNIRPHYFNLAILFFTGLILALIVFILITMYIRNRRSGKLKKWKLMANLLIRKAIFFEDDGDNNKTIQLTERTHQLLNADPHFRELLTGELLNARKNISGTSAGNLKQLYLQLGLQNFAVERLKSLKWYIKAQAIQELAVMGIKEQITHIYRFTNHAKELVRMEAQMAVVKLYGFEGLRFLDVVSYPITEWQQIRLLHELSHTPAENFSGIEKWLKSENKTVIVFALKLARDYHRFELYHAITACLPDHDPDVRLQAIITLGELYRDDTAALLIGRLLKEDIKHQLAIVKVLKNIAAEQDMPVLLDLLNTANPQLQLGVARSLAGLGPEGMKALQHHPLAHKHPLDQIINQIKSEVAV
ncbi:MAG: HEAT repeat domain-containing protein [Mucilaginibacter sp.]